MRCEDFPCCGHEAGDCPDSEGRFTCVTCGIRLPKRATSSICNRCRRSRVHLRMDEEAYYDNEF